MGFYVKYTNIIDSYALFSSLFDTLSGANGAGNGTSWFTQEVYYKDTQNLFAVFKSTANVDSYLTTDSSQIYRIAFVATISGGTTGTNATQGTITSMKIYIGTEKQIILSSTNPSTSLPFLDPSLVAYTIWEETSDAEDLSINLTSRGFSVIISKIHTINKKQGNSLICIQRPVNPLTGIVNIDGTCPIFALIQQPSDADNGLNFMVVREIGIDTSSYAVSTYNVTSPSGTNNATYIPGIMYKTSFDWVHPVMFDDASYVIKFPFGFISSRNVYLDEMDLISFVNATVFTSDFDLNVTLYSETNQRTYSTTYGPSIYGDLIQIGTNFSWSTATLSSARICQLKANGGI